MAGFRVADGDGVAGHLPAVAISEGDDVTRWDLVVIEPEAGLGDIWGESTVIVEGRRITNIARYGAKPLALASTSVDNSAHKSHVADELAVIPVAALRAD